VRERANSLSLSLSLSLSFKSSLFASARERDRRFLLSFLSPQQRRELIFSFFVEGAEELFWRQFFLLLSLSLSSQKISLRSYYFITQRLCAEQKAPALPHPLAPQNFTHIYNAYTYIKTKMAKVSFSRLCEQNTKREREWRIKYRASRVSSPFRSRARADFLFSFSRGRALRLWIFRFGKRRVKDGCERRSLDWMSPTYWYIAVGCIAIEFARFRSYHPSLSGRCISAFFPLAAVLGSRTGLSTGPADLRFTFAAPVSTQSRSFTIIKNANVVFFPFYASISTERSKESQIWDPVLLPGG